MTSRRVLKAAEAIREVVGMAILTDLNDPRIQDVTVTRVEVMPDMREAKVHVSVRGDETKQNLSLRGLKSAAGFLQSKIAKRIDTRYTPRLMFVLDQGVKKSLEISGILDKILHEDEGEISEGEVPEGETLEGEMLDEQPPEETADDFDSEQDEEDET